MLCKSLLVLSKFKFCLLELSGVSFSNIFNPRLVESMDSEPKNMEGFHDNKQHEITTHIYYENSKKFTNSEHDCR